MSETRKTTISTVDRDSPCPANRGGGHIPTTLERIVRGNHIKIPACKNCGGVIS